MARLEGRTALVTGASRGLGRAIAIALADDGMPQGGFPDVQVRISSHGPLGGPPCEPAPDARGYEYGWARPRSPCHGVLLTPLVRDEPTDVGDMLSGTAPRYGSRSSTAGASLHSHC